jgi:hypothetical protein
MKKTFNTILEVEKSRVEYGSNVKALIFCLNGLDELIYLAGDCVLKYQFQIPGESAEYAIKSYLNLPTSKMDCHGMFGESYVYMSCTNSCSKANCPLKQIPQDTCTNKVQSKVYALTPSNQLQVLLKQQNGYTNELFPCENKNCVPYSKVCNLANDCGDASDEKNCSNHFYCATSREFVPVTSRCDGFYDCRYYEDECNDECHPSDRQILGNLGLKVSTWIIGILAIVFNMFTSFKTIREIKQLETYSGMMNRILIFLVNLGDLMMGCYLISIASVDLYQGQEYCKKKFRWLTSTGCAALGMVNTAASQISLFAMTALSAFRIFSMGSMVQDGINNIKSICKIMGTITLILMSSLMLACIPILKGFEDFFVNGMFYDENPLFTASVSKVTHRKIFLEQYGRSRQTEYYSWQLIRKLVRRMFTDDYGGK